MPSPHEWRLCQWRQVNGAIYWISASSRRSPDDQGWEHQQQRQQQRQQQQQDDHRSPGAPSNPPTLAEAPAPQLATAEESALTIITTPDAPASESELSSDAWALALADETLQTSQSLPALPPLHFVREEGLPPAHAEIWWP